MTRHPAPRLHQFSTITRTPDEAATLLAGAGCLPCETASLTAAVESVPEGPATAVTWSGPIGVEGLLTGDGRFIDANALRWATLPIPLRWVEKDEQMGHAGALVVGRILTLERRGDGQVWGTGDFTMDTPESVKAAAQVDNATKSGISMDLDEVSFEIRVARELLEREEELEEADEANEVPEGETDSEGRVTVIAIKSDDEVMAITDARIRAATIVDIPAFEPARITLDSPLGDTVGTAAENSGGGEGDTATPEAASAVVVPLSVAASARTRPRTRFAVEPPAAWFADPGLTEPTRTTISKDGRIYGHVAIWGTCHTGYADRCVTPPNSPSNYAHYMTGTILTAEGQVLNVGRITMGTLHAGESLSASEAIAHYEQTGLGVAHVASGEDAFGIWVAGALRPNTTDEQIRDLRASPLSGDWRKLRGALEMIGALAVNVAGFPIPRPHGLVAGGGMHSLVAAGMLPPSLIRQPGTPGALSDDDLAWLRRLASKARAETEAEANDLARRVEAMALSRRVAALRSR